MAKSDAHVDRVIAPPRTDLRKLGLAEYAWIWFLLPVKYQFCRFIADGARRAGSNNSSASPMLVISLRECLLNSEAAVL